VKFKKFKFFSINNYKMFFNSVFSALFYVPLICYASSAGLTHYYKQSMLHIVNDFERKLKESNLRE